MKDMTFWQMEERMVEIIAKTTQSDEPLTVEEAEEMMVLLLVNMKNKLQEIDVYRISNQAIKTIERLDKLHGVE